MYCSQCGKGISNTSKFCQYCGSPVESDPKEETTIKGNESTPNTKTLQKKNLRRATKLFLVFIMVIIFFLIFTYFFFQYIGHRYRIDNIKSSTQTIFPEPTVESVVPKSQVQTVVPNPSSDWIECYKNEDGNVFLYKIGNIENNKGGSIVQVWVRTVYSDKGKEKVNQSRRNSGLSAEGWDKLSDEKWLYEIDCKSHRFNKLSFDYYDTDSNVLLSKVYDEPEWGNIIPNTILDISQKKVCRK
jgi:hypothetical protein